MGQTNIYEFLIDDVDPLLIQINRLRKGQVSKIEEYEITLNNFNIYEISSGEIHESFSTKEKCYQRLCEIVNAALLY